ncbi:putative drug efflux protein [Salmonella enterica subsp. enterica]|nr:putative drug efflux protein [Salmonella enterica subsp. enterica] [Salmonella enterica subsp. enterica serovar Menston]
MPLALFALTISAFAIGTTEFVIVGLVPTIAQQLAISLPSAGMLVSIYALGVAIGAPVLTALTGRLPRKQLLVALMVLFTAGNLLAWQAPGYMTLIVARLLTAWRTACSSRLDLPSRQVWCQKRKRLLRSLLCLVV